MTQSNQKNLRSGGLALLVGAGSIGKRHLNNMVELGVRNLFIVDPRGDRRQEAIALAKDQLAQLEPEKRGEIPLQYQEAATTQPAYDGKEPVSAVIIATPPRQPSRRN